MSSQPIPANHRRVDRGYVRDMPAMFDDEGPWAMHLAGPYDTSPCHSTYPSGYSTACSWCYLGAPHSEQAHQPEPAYMVDAPRLFEPDTYTPDLFANTDN